MIQTRRFAVLSGIGYAIYFPGSLFYFVLVHFGIIPPIFGGYYAVVALLITPVCLCSYSVNLIKRIGRASVVFDGLLVLFLTSIVLVSLVHLALGASAAIVTDHLVGAVYIALMIALFSSLDPDSNIVVRSNTFAVIIFSIFVIFQSLGSGFSMELDSGSTREVASYQYMAVSYLVCVTLILARTPSWLFRLLLFSVSTVVLFYNGARSEFILLPIIYLGIELLRSNRRMLLVLAPLMVVTLVVFFSSEIRNAVPDGRITDLIDNGFDSGSARTRLQSFRIGIAAISDSPFIGDYGSYEKGLYIHNILGLWVDFGIVGFSTYLIAIATCFRRAVKLSFKRVLNSKELTFTCFCVAASLMLLTSKTYEYYLVGATFGLYIALSTSTLVIPPINQRRHK